MSVDSATDRTGERISFSSIEEAEAHYSQSLDEATVDSFTVSGKPAIKVSGKLAGPGPGQGSVLEYIFLKTANKVLIIQLGYPEYKSTLEQILSTFKFTDSLTPTP